MGKRCYVNRTECKEEVHTHTHTQHLIVRDRQQQLWHYLPSGGNRNRAFLAPIKPSFFPVSYWYVYCSVYYTYVCLSWDILRGVTMTNKTKKNPKMYKRKLVLFSWSRQKETKMENNRNKREGGRKAEQNTTNKINKVCGLKGQKWTNQNNPGVVGGGCCVLPRQHTDPSTGGRQAHHTHSGLCWEWSEKRERKRKRERERDGMFFFFFLLFFKAYS